MTVPNRYRVINVRSASLGETYVYVGRMMPGRFAGHELANPFRLPRRATEQQRRECLERYVAWLSGLPDLRERLRRLQAATVYGTYPLGCWCCEWDGEEGEPMCHAVVLAWMLSGLGGYHGT